MTTLASHAYGGSQSSVVTVLARPVRPSLRFLCLAIVAAIHVILRIPPGFFPQVAGQTGTDPQRRSPLIADPSNSMVQFALRLLSRSKAQVPVLHCMLLILNRLQDKVSVYTQGFLRTHRGLFLAVLIVASNYVTGTPLSYKTWSSYADGFLSPLSIASMMRQVISLLEYDLHIPGMALRRRIVPLSTTGKLDAHVKASEDQLKDGSEAPSPVPSPRRRAHSAPTQFFNYRLE